MSGALDPSGFVREVLAAHSVTRLVSLHGPYSNRFPSLHVHLPPAVMLTQGMKASKRRGSRKVQNDLKTYSFFRPVPSVPPWWNLPEICNRRF